MKKKWLNPELKNLAVVCTNEEGCPYANSAQPTTFFPDIEIGDGKLGCKWNATGVAFLPGQGLCTNPNWTDKGLQALRWPCKQASVQKS